MRCINGFMRWLVCFRMLYVLVCVVGPTMRKPRPRRPIVGKLVGNWCLWRSSGRTTNAASLQDIRSMTAIAVIGGMTTRGRSPSTTPKSSMIATRSELEDCVMCAVSGVLYVCHVCRDGNGSGSGRVEQLPARQQRGCG
jgi:hypothetical protein